MTDLQRYSNFSDQFEAAYNAHRKTYAMQYPPPVRSIPPRDSWFIPASLLVILGASVIVSGSRTIDEFGGGLVGWAAFFMLEFTIVTMAFFRVRRSFNDKMMANSHRLAGRGLLLAFAVALAANGHRTLTGHGIEISSIVNLIINVAVALSAPSLAWIGGDILAIEVMAAGSRQRKADDEFARELQAWTVGLNEDFDEKQSKWGVKLASAKASVSAVDRPLLSAADGQTDSPADADIGHGNGQGYSKAMDARTKARAYLAQYPESVAMSVREFGDVVGIGKTVAAEVLKEYRKGNR